MLVKMLWFRPWPGEKFRYYPKFDLGIGAEWIMGTAEVLIPVLKKMLI